MFILFIGVFVILMILIFSILQMDESNTLLNAILSIIISAILSGCAVFLVSEIKRANEKDLQNCKETVSLIVPEIVYANDSSFKVLKYNYQSFPEKIIINVGDSLYNMNDSDYIVEPCDQKILKKRK